MACSTALSAVDGGRADEDPRCCYRGALSGRGFKSVGGLSVDPLCADWLIEPSKAL